MNASEIPPDERCSACNGTGQEVKTQPKEWQAKLAYRKCPTCGGTGRKPG
jgi:DnaJ-class molecular chaperone